jgi:tRNA/tmRNA/rRNA uracil-C5-methylase (TrmA/RlmC/RlmD family)
MTDVATAADLAAEYAAHADAKEARIASVLEEHGMGGLFRGLRRCALDDGYRMRASFYAGPDSDGVRRVVGVDPRRGRVPLEESLWVMPSAARPLVRAIGERIAAMPAEAGVTGFEVRLEFGSGRAHVTLAVERGSESLAGFCEELGSAFPAMIGISIPSQRFDYGDVLLRHELLGKTILTHHLAFFQTNRWLTGDLAAAAQAAAGDPSRIVDLYCGVGLHSILAATAESVVLGVDTNPWAIESAGRNARLHGLAHARYERIPAERLRGRPEVDRPSIVFVNPSRYGYAQDVPARVAGWRPAAICLVSCSIDSHARDLAGFLRAGYAPRPFESFDMFPFSDFVESVTELQPA